ncbi:variable surface lipoprotein [Mycoplasma sp. HS2188]|uniref:variable surface lipoprotein n=1 Tax=Mycoplasma sp. HS2188 TaxID=2976765 RepID=UPI0021AA8AD9|nr:variable surface lipoprotein [Mycoplasma sp. HS2188]MCT4469892.1 variable surface lipoprotein [Mycoplasma sp. HS2188]
MKNKFLIGLGAVLTTISSSAFVVSCNNTNENVKKTDSDTPAANTAATKVVLSTQGTKNAGEVASAQGDKQQLQYEQYQENFSEVEFRPTPGKTIVDADLITPKKGTGLQVFISTYDGATTVYGKSESKRPFEGIKLGTLENIPSGFTVANADRPTYQSKSKEYTQNSGYINVENVDGHYKIKFRFFRSGNREAQGTVGTEVYELFIS